MYLMLASICKENNMNLFFVTHLGQLSQVEALIKYEKIINNELIILYTNANKKIPKLIQKNVSKDIFSNISLVRLPIKPNLLHLSKLIKIYFIYKRIIFSKNYSNIYILSFERHYAFIGSLAEKRGIKIHLIEEGTATYKFNDKGENIAPVDLGKSIRDKISFFLIKYSPFFKKIKPALSYWKNFDCVYAAFPDKITNGFNFNRRKYFFVPALGGTIDKDIVAIAERYNIGTTDCIYVNQRYPVDAILFAEEIISIFDELIVLNNWRKVFIKFHPKDSGDVKKVFNEAIEKSIHAQCFTIIDEPAFLVEPIVQHSKPQAIIGIASTALVYTPLLSAKTQAICFGDLFLTRLTAKNAITVHARGLISSHIEIVKRFDNLWEVMEVDGQLQLKIIRDNPSFSQ